MKAISWDDSLEAKDWKTRNANTNELGQDAWKIIRYFKSLPKPRRRAREARPGMVRAFNKRKIPKFLLNV
jgi:hypothetical protein